MMTPSLFPLLLSLVDGEVALLLPVKVGEAGSFRDVLRGRLKVVVGAVYWILLVMLSLPFLVAEGLGTPFLFPSALLSAGCCSQLLLFLHF